MVIAFSVFDDRKEVFKASEVEHIERGFIYTRVFLKNKNVVEYDNAMWNVLTV